jgi:hypothetical protein
MARRYIPGSGQLLLSINGFGLFCAWFINVLRQFYGLINSDVEPHLRPWLAFSGIGLFALSWLWAWVTSISLLREGNSNERDGKLFGTPPVLSRT